MGTKLHRSENVATRKNEKGGKSLNPAGGDLLKKNHRVQIQIENKSSTGTRSKKHASC